MSDNPAQSPYTSDPPIEHTPLTPYMGQPQQLTEDQEAVAGNQGAPHPDRSNKTSERYFLLVGAILGLLLIGAVVFQQSNTGRGITNPTDELWKFLQIGIQFVPMAILGVLAYLGAKRSVGAFFAYLWLFGLGAAILFYALASVLLAFVKDFGLFNSLSRDQGLLSKMLADPAFANQLLADIFKPGLAQAVVWTLLLLALVAVISLLMLLRPVRVMVSRIMPVDPDNFVHKIALCILTLILLAPFVPLIVLEGRAPILEMLKSGNVESLGDAVSVRPIDLVYQFIWTIPATLLVAGWPIARNFRAVLVRLGMVRPSVRQAAFGVAAGLVLAAIAGYGIDPAIHGLWTSMGWPTTDVEVFSKLLTHLFTPLGAVLIGVTAGVGEEMAVRGLLQPRIGLIASNLVFTGFHAFQYGPDALVSVFIIGLVLGVIRARTNTTTSAIVHGVYDFIIILASSLGR